MNVQGPAFAGFFRAASSIIGPWRTVRRMHRKIVDVPAPCAHTERVALDCKNAPIAQIRTLIPPGSPEPMNQLHIGILLINMLVACKVNGHYVSPDAEAGSDAASIDAPVVVGDGNVSCALRVAFEDGAEGSRDVWVTNPDGIGLVNVSNSPADDLRPSWAPDGKRILFESNRRGNFDIFVVNADGSGLKNLTEGSTASDTQAVWSPDGQRIAFVRNLLVWTMNADGTGAAQVSALQQSNDIAWSKDSTKVIFGSARPNVPAVMVATVGSMAAPLQLSPVGVFAGGASAAPNDKALFYSGSPNNDIFSVNLDGTGLLNVTQSSPSESSPQWTDDGQVIVFTSDKNGRSEIWKTSANGGVQMQVTSNGLMPFGQGDFVTDVSPDGQLVAFRRKTSETVSEVGVIHIDGSGLVTFSSGAKNAQRAKFGVCP